MQANAFNLGDNIIELKPELPAELQLAETGLQGILIKYFPPLQDAGLDAVQNRILRRPELHLRQLKISVQYFVCVGFNREFTALPGYKLPFLIDYFCF